MTIDEMIAVLTAAKAGKAEWRYKKSESPEWSPWLGQYGSALNTSDFDYRVKPEPREWTVWVDLDGVISEFGNHSGKGCATRIKVREVIE